MSTKKPYAELRADGSELGPVTFEEAKELIGWKEETSDENWGTEFGLKDMFGKKVRLLNNPTNRPLKLAIAKRYASEFLRGVWKLNLETIVFGLSGNVRDGQHRLVGFILAEQMRQLDPKQWGSEPLTMEVLLGFNVSDDKETADSYDKGQSRSLDDVIYRHEDFSQKTTDKEQRKISKTLSGALRMTWIRCGGMTVSSAPHFPHSEAMEFYGQHKGIMKSVKKIIALDSPQDGEGSTKLISSLVSLAYASSLHYLMSKVDADKANEFWGSLASGEGLSKGSPILVLSTHLRKSVAGSGAQRDAIYGACVKAWNAYLEGSKVATKDITVKKKKTESGKFVLAELPRIGGLDVDKEAPERLTLRQQRVIKGLKDLGKEVTYEALAEATGLSKGIISKEAQILMDLKLVSVNQYPLEEGEKGKPPYMISLKGVKRARRSPKKPTKSTTTGKSTKATGKAQTNSKGSGGAKKDIGKRIPNRSKTSTEKKGSNVSGNRLKSAFKKANKETEAAKA